MQATKDVTLTRENTSVEFRLWQRKIITFAADMTKEFAVSDGIVNYCSVHSDRQTPIFLQKVTARMGLYHHGNTT